MKKIISTLIIVLSIFLIISPVIAGVEQDVRNLLNRGEEFMALREYEQALGMFEKGLELCRKKYPKQAEIGIFQAGMALASSYLGREKQALEYVENALQTARNGNDKTNIASFLLLKGDILFRAGQPEPSIQSYQESMKIAGELGEKSMETDLHIKLSTVYRSMGNMENALASLKTALEKARKNRDRNGQALAEEEMGNLYLFENRSDEALKQFGRALELAEEIQDKSLRSILLLKIGDAYRKLGDLTASLNNIRKAYDLAENPNIKETATGNLAVIYLDMGNFDKALEYFDSAISMARKWKNRPNEAKWIGGLGSLYLARGEYGRAMQCFNRAIEMAESLSDNKSADMFLQNKATLLILLEEYEPALNIFRKISARTKDRRLSQILTRHTGIVLEKTGNPQNALMYYEKSLNMAQNLKNTDEEIRCLESMGDAQNRLGEYEKAFQSYDRALKMAMLNKNDHAMEKCLGEMGNLMIIQKKFTAAEDYINRAISLGNSSGSKNNLFRWYGLMGMLNLEMGNKNEGIENLEKSLRIVESLRESISGDDLRSSFTGQYQIYYEKLIELLISEGQAESALNWAERAKARNFLDKLGRKHVSPKAPADKKMAEEELTLSTRISVLEKTRNGLSGEELAEMNKKITELTSQRDRLLSSLIKSNPEYAGLITVTPCSLKEIQGVLKENEALLEYYTGRDNTYIWVITRNGITAEAIPAGTAEISAMAGNVRDELVISQGKRLTMKDVEYCRKRLNRLYNLIIGPVEKALTGQNIDRLLIVPHSGLHYVPFSALFNNTGKYLIENFTITAQPSASSLVHFRKRTAEKPDSFTGFAIGSIGRHAETTFSRGMEESELIMEVKPELFRHGFAPLPGTVDEINGINREFANKSKNGKPFMEEEFTLSAVDRNAPTAGFLHFATHGVLSQRARGEFSCLIASDGYIFIKDIYGWNLNADTVTLSACKTGLGSLSGGDDMVSLSRAFMQAGTDNLIATLWSVQDDSTRDMMLEIYNGIMAGKSRPDSVRDAQLKLMKKYPHPFFWAPFVIYGKG